MLLSHKTDIQLNTTESNIVGHMCYAASKLWNVCNYERRNFKELGMVHYPDWYDQKARLKRKYVVQIPALADGTGSVQAGG